MNITLDRHQVEIGKPIKELGDHQVTVKLAPGITAKANITIEAVNKFHEDLPIKTKQTKR